MNGKMKYLFEELQKEIERKEVLTSMVISEGINLALILKGLLECDPELLPDAREYLLDRIERLLGK